MVTHLRLHWREREPEEPFWSSAAGKEAQLRSVFRGYDAGTKKEKEKKRTKR